MKMKESRTHLSAQASVTDGLLCLDRRNRRRRRRSSLWNVAVLDLLHQP